MTGTYILGISVFKSVTVSVGALGTIEFSNSRYMYIGSAFGPGGFDRIDRHRRVASRTNDTQHWHIDYLLSEPGVDISLVITFPERDLECALPDAIPGEAVPAFGSSDCHCKSHLLAIDDTTTVASIIESMDGQVTGSFEDW